MFELILAVFVVYRLSQMITIDEGPAIIGKVGIFLKFRTLLGAYDLRQDGKSKTNIGRGINCFHCVSTWIAIPIALILGGIQWYTLIYWLAISGLSSFIWDYCHDVND